jgi:drug/metabolite transporter (DMT)-like permease
LPLSIAIITFAIGYYLFYTGIFQADASTFAPLFQLQGGLIAMLAFLFLGERFPLTNYLWISLLIIGAVLVTIDESMKLKSLLKKGVLLILLMQVFHAISNLFVGLTLKYIGPVEILFMQYLALGVILIPFYLAVKPRLKYSVKSLSPLFLASCISAVGAIFLFKAFQTNLTVSSAISLLNAPIVFIISVLASSFFPQLLEHHSRKVYILRAVGLLIILLGAFKLTT